MRAKIVLSTCRDIEEARGVGQPLVNEGLAACVSITPGVESIYRWRGQTVREAEALLIMKTSDARLAELEKRLKELHSYEVPEFVVIDAEQLSAEYAAWLGAAVAPRHSPS